MKIKIIFSTMVIFLLVAANRPTTNTKLKYTPYEIMVWELKANEGYRSWWYADGHVRGRQSYSIGFGWNDQGRRRHEIKKYTADGKVTFNEATEITINELNKYGTLHKDPLKNIALKLYSYARGFTKDSRKLGGCCGWSKGCGNANKSVRKSHNRRRKFEVACWKKDYATINRMTEENLLKIKTMNR